ncbi:MAG TPA: AraC family transcriptional regulator [Gemmatimonadaceae bacterium]
MRSLDTIVFETPLVRAAQFRCDVRDPRFRDSGPTENFLVVFPRTAVWIAHAESRPFVSDPSIATIYNTGQEYRREAISHDGDRCDWLAVAPAIAREISEAIDESARDREKPFAAECAPVTRDLYLAQRAFFKKIERGEITSSLEAEETVISLVTSVIALSHHHTRERRPDIEWQNDLVERTKAALVSKLLDRQSLGELAATVDVSPFHLCRVFRKATGRTLHEYKTDLRLRFALQMMDERSADLSWIAIECGFSSHSHFTAAMRSMFGATPSELRKALA